VAVVNHAWMRRVFPGVGPAGVLGRRFRVDARREPNLPGEPFEIVGVVGDTRGANLRDDPAPVAYLPMAQHPRLGESLQVLADDRVQDPESLAPAIRQAVRDAHPQLAVLYVRSIADDVDRTLRGTRLLATLSTGFGLAALFLVCVGLYGVIAQWAGQRTGEIGVRMALGATAASVRWLVMREALVLAVAGVAVGLPAAIAAGRLLEASLWGISPTDAATLALATLTMFAVAALAAYLPARRASRVDPMVALRAE
jgi:ABC-type antimicrobial peptide transport system permease subunit